ncbi:nucleosome-remodeling factor subunit NURF301-like [Homalodisca vitripennis]|uniref:nucleosome-remodeling factor subunit NURF301-like n=1 Tax=Homalodisca vitripennis TaxID=197043 RepID=UPI001EEA8293|nr:nucleosome-remodeling factor subunit NURF301-like [Homalodisca vitripennis]
MAASYWFLTRRIFVESEDGESWYYSSPAQLDELLESLDPTEFEAPLCREINDFKDEIIRQMELTEEDHKPAQGEQEVLPGDREQLLNENAEGKAKRDD